MLMDYLCRAKDDKEQQKVRRLLTSMMEPSWLDTSFWNSFLFRFSFPLEVEINVVTNVLMAASISKERKTRTKRQKEI